MSKNECIYILECDKFWHGKYKILICNIDQEILNNVFNIVYSSNKISMKCIDVDNSTYVKKLLDVLYSNSNIKYSLFHFDEKINIDSFIDSIITLAN